MNKLLPSSTPPPASCCCWQLPEPICMTIAKCTNFMLIEREITKSTWNLFVCCQVRSEKNIEEAPKKRPKNQAKISSQLVQVSLLYLCACVCVVRVCESLQVRYKSNSCGLPASHSTKSTCSVQSSCESVQKKQKKRKYWIEKNTKKKYQLFEMFKFVFVASLLVSVALAAPVSE